ncbi:AraC family transcriptional regulator [Flavobacterium sp. ANB]|uniref:helix-turn-helix domain-containing protein n=1 Tax=unclassified Flavobacterium TaxID=196869 RepID=UPI0012B97844|nr:MULTISPECIES: helix-turn-helix domain-containing protein [unclassified Flavobacterium]MBF4518398.1 AraC family transcriptional regulator [Flavobacterium sp. ANB]MTD70908.1 helix-turn-helix domain-containing protein [Flavobacterium sp. LC2016-13]
MSKKRESIPVNAMTDNFDGDISIERICIDDLLALDKSNLPSVNEATGTHRHDSHSFFLLENGTVQLDIDFQKYIIKAPSIIYIHPDQVHRTIASENVIVSSWSISNESINAEYLKLLLEITPAKPLGLTNEMFLMFSEAVSLFIKFSERKDDKLNHSILKESCNALVALVISQYLEQSKPTDKPSRFETITKAFRQLLESNYATIKRPAEYAQKLHLSTPYLNECIKNTTGFSVSYHIQQRVILEAKRLLYHSDKSVKEIASDLGYDDYPYFSRLFTKVTGMTALTFRSKNLD